MTSRLSGIPLVHVIRGSLVESVHEIAACAMDAAGRVVFAAGDIEAPVYLRSSAKPFIAAAAVRAGVVERFGLTSQELAVMSASHSGEPFHVEAARSILHKTGLDEGALQCGADYPYAAETIAEMQRRGIPESAIYHNCSGKHAGLLALCVAIGADPATYLDPDSPAQELVLSFCARMSNVPVEDLAIGVDGCGIPAYAVSLSNVALAYMRYATLEGIDDGDARALRRVRDATIAHPEYTSGTGEFDAALIRAGRGALSAKGGAEGMHATALIDRGIGVAVKVIDGTPRARPPAAIAVLRTVGGLSPLQVGELRDFANPPIANRAGRVVGELRACEIAAS